MGNSLRKKIWNFKFNIKINFGKCNYIRKGSLNDFVQLTVKRIFLFSSHIINYNSLNLVGFTSFL
jgi:hypothetical protein